MRPPVAMFSLRIPFSVLALGAVAAPAAAQTWVHASPPGGHVISLAVGADDRVYAGILEHGLYRSDDGGASFTRATGLAAPSVTAVAVQPGTGAVFAGTMEGTVFRSDDEGATWAPLPLGVDFIDDITDFA